MEIAVKHLCKSFGGRTVLRDLTFTAGPGITAVMAPSGTGKTTLLRILLGLERPDSGTVEGLAGKRLTAVFQEDRLLEHLSAEGNLRFVLGRVYDPAAARALLDRLDCRVVEERDLPGFDLEHILFNVNTPGDYRHAEKISNSSLQ